MHLGRAVFSLFSSPQPDHLYELAKPAPPPPPPLSQKEGLSKEMEFWYGTKQYLSLDSSKV